MAVFLTMLATGDLRSAPESLPSCSRPTTWPHVSESPCSATTTPAVSLFSFLFGQSFFTIGAQADTTVGSDDLEFQNHYEVLGIDQSATDEEIKKAYRKLARKYHPDKVKDQEKEQATNVFMAIGRAHEVLMDKDKRSMFDDELFFGRQRGGRGGRGGGFSEGGIFDQLRKERLRKQEARKNSFMGRFDSILSYIVPMFLIFGFLRANGLNIFGNSDSPGNPGANSAGPGGVPSSNAESDGSHQADASPTASSSSPSSPHDSDAATLAPALSRLGEEHLSPKIKVYVIVFCVRQDPSADIPWAKLNDLVKGRRADKLLLFAWADIDSLPGDSTCSKVIHRCDADKAPDFCTLALRPKKSKGVVHPLGIGVPSILDGSLQRLLDGLLEGTIQLEDIDMS